MSLNQQVVTVVGGTGFLGRYVVRELAKAGYTVRVLSRHPDSALFLKTAGHVGQIVLQKADLSQPESLAGKLEGSFAVVNLVGVLFEHGRQNFSALHARGAECLAQEAAKESARRFIQISALGADKARHSRYARTKSEGERAVSAAFQGATILRPSVLFGTEDNFFNQFACMARYLPALPLIGGGKTRFQPVYAADVARAICVAIQDKNTEGQTYELGGPRVYSFREILEYIMKETNRRRMLAPIPFAMASLMGMFGKFLPRPPLTSDQVTLLKYDNVVDRGAKTFVDLGITPTPVEMVVPGYIQRFRARSRNLPVERNAA